MFVLVLQKKGFQCSLTSFFRLLTCDRCAEVRSGAVISTKLEVRSWKLEIRSR